MKIVYVTALAVCIATPVKAEGCENMRAMIQELMPRMTSEIGPATKAHIYISEQGATGAMTDAQKASILSLFNEIVVGMNERLDVFAKHAVIFDETCR